MASEIRANTLKNRVGLGTISFTDSGPVVSGIATANTFRLPDATSGSLGRLQLGNGLHLSLYHNGSNSFLVNNNGYLSIQSQAGVNGIFIARNAEVNLYFGSSVRLQTSSAGVTINKDLDVDGHTNLDNVSIAGVTTFSDHILVKDDKEIRLGDTNDFRLFHDNTNTLNIINAQSGNFRLQQAGTTFLQGMGTGVKAYFGGTERLATTNAGVSITKDLDVDGHTNLDNVSIAGITTIGALNQSVYTPAQSNWATRSALTLFGNYGGGLAFNDNNNNGFVQFVSNSGNDFWLSSGAVGGSSSPSINATKGGAVQLYHAGTSKISTASYGAAVNGDLEIAGSLKHLGDTDTKISFDTNIIHFDTDNTERLRITSAGHTIPGANVTYDLGENSSSRWRNIYGQTLSLTSYATVGSIVAADPGSAYYAYNNRIGNGLAIAGNTRMFNNIGIGTGRTTGLTNWEGPSDINFYLKSNNASGTIRWNYEDSGGTVRANHAFINYGNNLHDYFSWSTHDGSSIAERVRISKEGDFMVKNTSAATPRSDFIGNLRPISQIASTWNAYHSLTRHDAGSSYGPYLILAKNKNNAYNSNGAVADNDEFGNVSFQGNDGSVFREGARIRGEVDGTVASNQMPGALGFWTNNGSGVAERLRISSGGAVLIGNTSTGFTVSSAPLVVGTGSGDNGISIYAGNTSSSFIHFADGTSGSDRYRGYVNYSHNLNALQFGTNDIERLRIASSGYVTMPYQVAFFAHCTLGNHDLSAGDKFQFNSIPSSGNVAVNSNHTTFGGTNVFNTSTNTFTAPVAGLYSFTVTVYYRRTGDALSILVPRVNNNEVSNGNNGVFFLGSNDITDGNTESGTLILQLAAGDEVTVNRRTGQSGTCRYYGPHSHFCGHLIG